MQICTLLLKTPCPNFIDKFTIFDADSMGSYPPGAVVTLVVYGTTDSYMNIYPIVLYATEDSMCQFHRQIFTEFDADPMGSYPPGAVVNLVAQCLN